MRKISELIDSGTCTKKIIVTNGLHQNKDSGWIACSINHKLVELYRYFSDAGDFVSYKGEHYIIDTPCKPISGPFQLAHLQGYY